jgi:hypothetical protein
MACFLVTAAEAAVVTAVAHGVELHEIKKEERLKLEKPHNTLSEETALPWSRKLKWLSWLLWGGAVLLMFEHLWHGEITPWFPFLTAAANPTDMAEMFHEMATVGVTMALIVTAAWAAMVAVATAMMKREAPSTEAAQ